jgi:tryptophan halogenase
VQRVVVVGRDAPAWIAALAIRRVLGDVGVTVTALELPTFLEDTDAYCTVPAMESLHELLGFDESILAAHCMGVPLVGQRFSNWSRTRQSFIHGYDAAAPPEEPGFTQYWLKARARGLQVEYEDFSLAAAAAKQGRVPLAETSGAGLAADAGYQVDALRYAALLKHYALRKGVEHRSGRVADVEIVDGRIAAVAWEGGERFEADLFIDASGPEAILVGKMPDDRWESWSEWLPCDQILTASGAALEPLPAFSQLSAFRAGWIRLEPLQDRTAVTACFAGNAFDEDMLQNLDVLAGIRIKGDAVIAPSEPGIRPRPWLGNCVAVGAAAARLEPLYPVDLHMVHVGVTQLIGSLVAAGGAITGAEAYNEAINGRAISLRDLQIAHYRLNRRFDEGFWDRAREMVPPAALEEKLTTFSSTGRIPINVHDAFRADDWATVFIGHGQIPQAYDRRVDDVPDEEVMAKLHQRLRDIATLVNAMPTVDEYTAAAKRPRGEKG